MSENNSIEVLKFKNGLTAVVCRENIDNRGITYFRFGTNMGDAATLHLFGDKALGAAHLIEHCLFHDSERFRKYDLKKTLALTGAAVNAYTSKNEVVTHCIGVLDRYAPQLHEIMSDMFFNPVFREKLVEQEKRPVIQEIHQYNSNFQTDFWTELTRGIYGSKSVYGKPILGTVESVSNIESSDMRKWWSTAVEPQNVVVSVVGNNKSCNEIVRSWKKKFGDLASSEKVFEHSLSEDVDMGFATDIKNLDIPITYFEKAGQPISRKRNELQQNFITVAYPKNLIAPAYTEEFLEYDAMCELFTKAIGMPFSSRTWQTFREDSGSAYASHVHNVRGIGSMKGYMSQVGSYRAKPKKIIGTCVKLVMDVCDHGLKSQELDSALNYIETSILRSDKSWAMARDTAVSDINALSASWLEMNSDPEKVIERYRRVRNNKGAVSWSDMLSSLRKSTPVIVSYGCDEV